MGSKVANARKSAKKVDSRIRNPNSRIRNQISPVMQTVKGLLPEGKAAQTLAFLLDEPLGTCQKLLCGERDESAKVLAKLLCVQEHGIGRAVLLTIGEGQRVDYIEEVRRRDSLRAMRRNLEKAQKFYSDAIAAELAQ